MNRGISIAQALVAARNLGNVSAYVAGRSNWSRLDAAIATKEYRRLMAGDVATLRGVHS